MREEYDKSMLTFLRERRSNTGNRDVWSYYGSHMLRDDFYVEVDRLASFLLERGYGKGSNIAICLPNIPNAVVAVYAVNKIGAVANIVHPLIPCEGMRHIIKRVGSEVLFVFDLFYEEHRSTIEELGIPTIVCSAGDYVNGARRMLLSLATVTKTSGIKYCSNVMRYRDVMRTEIRDVVDEGRGEDIAVYLHSGGTMGESKTVMLSNRALNALADNTSDLIGGVAEEDDGMLMVLPLFHGFGLGVCMHTTMCASCRMVMIPVFKPKSTIKTIKREHVTMLAGVPTMYDKLMREPTFVGDYLKDIKHCYCGGDKLPIDTKRRFDAIMHMVGSDVSISEGYGLTEVVAVCSVNTEEDARFPSVGKGLKGVEFAIVDRGGSRLEPGEIGEICVHSDTMMTGYYDDEESTSLAMTSDKTGKIWIHTGDIGYLDEDGYLYFKDRLKRMVKISGMNVFPKEIEEIAERVDGIEHAVALSSTLEGKPIIKLLVVLKRGCTFDDSMKNTIRTAISSELMKYSVPRVIEARESLPLTIVGKVDYRQLQDIENNNIEE